MPEHVVVGTAGHIDHGKSTLVRALTGIDPDRWEEEKRRGITIDIGFAHHEYDGVLFAFIDVPGHERFVHNMLAGASGIDLVMLVVAADESVMPQTREHLAICRLLGVRRGLVALTRIDLADPEMLDLVEQEIEETIAGTFLEGAPVVRASGTTGEGLDALREALVRQARAVEPRREGPWPRLPIDRVFAARGFGTVVTGTLQGGVLAAGDELLAIPGGRRGRIRGLQVHGRPVAEVGPRHRVAVNLSGIDRGHLARGQVLVPPGCAVVTRLFDALVEVVGDAPVPVEHRMRVRMHHGTAEVMARVRIAGSRRIEPGATAACQLRLEAPVAVLPGDRFVIRRFSPVCTLGGGSVCEIDPPRRRLVPAAWEERVRELAEADPPRRLAVAVRDAGPEGLALASASLRCGLLAEQARCLAREGRLGARDRPVRLFGESRLVSAEGLEALLARLVERIERYHREQPLGEGLPPGRLRAEVAPRWEPDAFRDLLGLAASRGLVSADPSTVARAGHEAVLDPEGEELCRRIVSALEEAEEPFLPAADLARVLGSGPLPAPLLSLACRRGDLVRVREGVYMAKSRFDRIARRVGLEAAEGRTTIDVGRFKELFGLSRKYAIPLLECLDDHGVTRRAGPVRVIRRPGPGNDRIGA